MSGPQIAIVDSSELDTGCWDARRYCDACDTCDRVMTCKVPEATPHRIRILEKEREAAQALVNELDHKIEEERRKLDGDSEEDRG